LARDGHVQRMAPSQDEDPNQACCVLCRKSFVVWCDGIDASNQWFSKWVESPLWGRFWEARRRTKQRGENAHSL